MSPGQGSRGKGKGAQGLPRLWQSLPVNGLTVIQTKPQGRPCHHYHLYCQQCYTKIADWVAERTEIYFFYGLEARSPRPRCPQVGRLLWPLSCPADGRLLPGSPRVPSSLPVSPGFLLLLDGQSSCCFRVPPSWSHLTYISSISRASQAMLVVKNPPPGAGDVKDTGLIPGLGRSPGGGHGDPLLYSYLETLMDRGAWRSSPWGCRESDTTEAT